MHYIPDGGEDTPPSLSGHLSSHEVNMDLTTCGLLPDQAAKLTQLYAEHKSWPDVKQVWFNQHLSNRATRDSAQQIYRILSSRLKNAPASLPNPSRLPFVLEDCHTSRDKAQVLYLYLVANDPLVRYTLHEYTRRLLTNHPNALDFSNDTLTTILDHLTFSNGGTFDYADSTTRRWCQGFRSLMREIDVLDGQQAVVGSPPNLRDIPLLVAIGYSYEDGGDDWLDSPIGLLYLYQPRERWQESFNRVGNTPHWEFVEVHGQLQLRPTETTYAWIPS